MTSPSIASNRTQITHLPRKLRSPPTPHSRKAGTVPHFCAGVTSAGLPRQPTPAGRPGRPTHSVPAARPADSTYRASALQTPDRRVAMPRPRPKSEARGHSCPSRWDQGRGSCGDDQIQYGRTKQVQRPAGQMQRSHQEVTEAEDGGRRARDRVSENAPSPFCFHCLPPRYSGDSTLTSSLVRDVVSSESAVRGSRPGDRGVDGGWWEGESER